MNLIAEEAARLAFRLLNAEEQAFIDFQRCYRRTFLAIFRGLGFSHMDSEDLAINAITDIALMVSKWDSGRGNFDGWVRTVATNIGLGRLREDSKQPKVPLAEGFDVLQQERSSSDPEREQAVHEALAALSPSDRILVESRELDLDQASYSDIAGIISRVIGEEVKEGTLRARHKRALERLRIALGQDVRIKFRNLVRHDEGVQENDRPTERIHSA